MIKDASDLLALFIAEEAKKVAGITMPHMPTLGSAYEEITKQGIDKEFVIPKGLDLRVVKGFVSVSGKQLPNQIDCMLVVGEGVRYGLTDQYIYEIDSVLCIFEVKKTLTKSDFEDAIFHLSEIRSAFSEDFAAKVESGVITPDITHARKSFSQITGKIAPEKLNDAIHLPKLQAVLLRALVHEQFAPVTIIHGYEGYKTEVGLRKSFTNILEERSRVSVKGLGASGLTSLVTAGEFCLIKSNGYPYMVIQDNHYWVAFSSTRYNSARIILELIWSKISQRFDIVMPYGSDQEVESLAPLLIAEPIQKGAKFGWSYQALTFKEKTLAARSAHLYWSPEHVTAAEAALIIQMMFAGGMITKSRDLEQYLMVKFQRTYDKVVENLLKTKMFALTGKSLRPLATLTMILENTDDGTAYIALDRNRFDHWCLLNKLDPHYTNLVYLE